MCLFICLLPMRSMRQLSFIMNLITLAAAIQRERRLKTALLQSNTAPMDWHLLLAVLQ